jgi:hypothetical protein
MRAFLVVGILLFGSPCFAQRAAAPQSIQHGVGDRLVITAPIVVAADDGDSLELAKSFEAKDKEGITAMLESAKAIKLEAGLTLVVLEITTRELPRRDRCTVCRVIKDGKAIGKFPIHYVWFTTATMKKVKEAD